MSLSKVAVAVVAAPAAAYLVHYTFVSSAHNAHRRWVVEQRHQLTRSPNEDLETEMRDDRHYYNAESSVEFWRWMASWCPNAPTRPRTEKIPCGGGGS